MYIKLEIKSGDFGGYNIVLHWLRDSDKKRGKTLVASGFNNTQKAIDYARLYCYELIKLAPAYDFTVEQKSKIQDIRAEVANQYCLWQSFIDNVINDSRGLAGLLGLIEQGKNTREIVNEYI